MTRTKLLNAEKIAVQLFEAVEENNLIIAGKPEAQLAAEVTNLALEKFGIKDHWHKKIVRAGVNTLATYSENPAGKIIQEGDILFIDFGPIVDGYEADLGRTYVIGNNAARLKLKNDVEKQFEVKQTGNNPKHHTVILPKPVTEQTAEKFNSLFKPK